MILTVRMLDSFLAFAASFLACGFSALSGGGAGLILMPALLFMGLAYPTALASLKLAVGFIGVGSGYRFWKAGLIDLKGVFWSAILGMPWVALATYLSGTLPGQTMGSVVGWAILTIVLITVCKPALALEHNPQPFGGWRLLITALLFIPIGFYSGWISAGSGVLTTLIYVYIFRFDQRHAIALTMAANGVFWNGLSAAIHISLGHVSWTLAPALILGAILGSYVGASLALKVNNKALKWVFSLSAAASGVVLAFR